MSEKQGKEQEIQALKAEIFDLIKAGEIINRRRVALLTKLQELQQEQEQKSSGEVE